MAGYNWFFWRSSFVLMFSPLQKYKKKYWRFTKIQVSQYLTSQDSGEKSSAASISQVS